MRAEGHLPDAGRATKGGSLSYSGSNGNAPHVASELSATSLRRVPGWKAGSRYYVHSAFTAALAAANDFAHAGDANRLAWSDLLPSETRWLGRRDIFSSGSSAP